MGLGEWNERRRREKMIRERTEKANATRDYKKISYDLEYGCVNCNQGGSVRIPQGSMAKEWLSRQTCPRCKNPGTLIPLYDE